MQSRRCHQGVRNGVAALVAISISSVVLAQQEPNDLMVPVEQRVEDRGPLSASLRWVQYGLNQPYDFNDLYRLQFGEGDYVRRNSGVWAVFPRSFYIDTPDGVFNAVPAGTVYYLGGPDEVLPQIARMQAPYSRGGQATLARAVEERLEAELIDLRVPSSSIDAMPAFGPGNRAGTPGGTPVSSRVDTRMELGPPRTHTEHDAKANAPASEVDDERMRIREMWLSAVPQLEFINNTEYRRACVKAVLDDSTRP